MTGKIGFLGFGILFGFALSRVGASNFDLIFGMFTGEDLKIAWVILLAILIGHIGIRILTGNIGRNRTRLGQPIKISHKKLSQWSLMGAALFGIGWGMAGACPGTVLAQIGEGKLLGLFTLAGMVVGTYFYAVLKEDIPDL